MDSIGAVYFLISEQPVRRPWGGVLDGFSNGECENPGAGGG